MKYFISPSGVVYQGDGRDGDLEVPEPPSSLHEWDGAGWVLDPKKAAIASILALEREQQSRITARADREFRMALFVSAGLVSHPAYLALKRIDDDIKTERQKL